MKKLPLIASSALLMLLANSSYAEDYFVKLTGSDANDCLSWADACKSLSSAVTKASAAGDSIFVAGGVYYPTAQISLKNGIKIYGGYNPANGAHSANKYPTVFSGDTDHGGAGADTNKVAGVTQNHTGIKGTNLDRLFHAADLKDVILQDFTITAMDSPDHGSAIWHQTSEITYNNIRFLGNRAGSLGTVLVFGNDIYAKAWFNDCFFSGNRAGTGAAINAHRTGHAEINNTTFVNNEATAGDGGAIYVNNGPSSIAVDSSTFENNRAANGGAIAIVAGSAPSTVLNSTFVANHADYYGGAMRIYGSGHNIKYSTFFANDATDGAGGIQNDSGALNTLFGSLVLGNISPAPENINAVPGQLKDEGYNLIGSNGNASAAFTFVPGKHSSSPNASIVDIIDTNLKMNGGNVKTVALKAASVARDLIPNDSIAFYGVGRSAEYPFTSLVQAHGAIKSFENYQAGIYYFDLGGVYADAASYYAFTPGPLTKQFTTYVDSEGWVLLAAGEASTDEKGIGYVQTSDLALQSDSTLKSSAFSSLDFDQVRISASTDNSGQGLFDVNTNDSRVVADIKAYQRIRNTTDLAPAAAPKWNGTFAAKMHTAATTCSDDPNIPGGTGLNLSVFGSCGDVNGFHWQQSRDVGGKNIESTPDWNTATTGAKTRESMNLWVRSNNALCNGAISTTDGRGLPRADFVNPNDPGQYGDVHNCDVGAFEYNDGYKYDCYSEDGMRPENYVDFDAGSASGSGSHQTCFGGDIFGAAPKALIDNVGSLNYGYLVLLSFLLAFRRRK